MGIIGVERNKNLELCESEVFFHKLRKRIASFSATYPDARILKLGIGDASEPIPEVITSAMEKYARGLSTLEGFSGYGSHEGIEALRIKVAECLYNGLGVKASEVFLSDGAKGSFTRLQILFGSEVTIAVPDPSYPMVAKMSYLFAPSSQAKDKVVYMKGNPNNNFFPDLATLERTDLIYFCSPNNPTGTAATREELTELVAFAKKNRSIIIYDAVYSAFISDDSPKSIYEIPGAEKVAIEVGSFSKVAGFTGVRLGWVIVPEKLCYVDGKHIIDDFHKVSVLTFSSGPSNIVQAGGLACLTEEGIKETKKLIAYYKENARILLNAFASLGMKAYGGENSPFIWIEFPGRGSNDVFDEWLEKAHIISTPGILFGPSSDGFLRISAFGHRENILEAVDRLKLLHIC